MVGPLQDAAVLAADPLLSPIPPEVLSAREFARGTLEMLARLDEFTFLGIEPVPLVGVLYRMDRTVDARRIALQLREAIRGLSAGKREVRLANVTIPAIVAFREAATARIPAHRVSPTANICLRQLASELMDSRDFAASTIKTPQETPA